MPIKVFKDSIDEGVVREWQRIMKDTAEEKGHNLSSVEPFHLRGVFYGDVMREIREKSQKGLEYYRLMVRICPGYYFE